MQMNTFKNIKAPVILITILIGVSACNKQNSAESAVKSIDTAIENTSSEVKYNSQKMGVYMDDSVVTAKVKAALLADSGMQVFEINVETAKGITTLQGAVDSNKNKKNVEVMIAGIDGVKHVNNELVIESVE
jgi:hyperosmotically inducible protein